MISPKFRYYLTSPLDKRLVFGQRSRKRHSRLAAKLQKTSNHNFLKNLFYTAPLKIIHIIYSLSFFSTESENRCTIGSELAVIHHISGL